MEQVHEVRDPKQFDQAVLEAVDEALSTFGESCKQWIYYYAETRHQIKREEICNKIEAFNKALKDLFGAGAEIISWLTAKSIHERLGLSFKEQSGWRLVDYLDDAKKATGPVEEMEKNEVLDFVKRMKPRGKKNLKKQSKASVKGHHIVHDVIERKSIGKRPAVSEQAYRDLADHAATGMATVDLKGRFTYVNKVMANFMGHPARDLMGRPFKDYIHPEDRSRITRLFLKAVLLRRPPRKVELRAMGPEGSVRHLLMRPSPMRAGGKTVGFSAIVMDITERKQMEERLKKSEEQYRELAESITDMLFVMDRDLRYTYWNKASETGTGISAENAVGKTSPGGFSSLRGKADR